MERNMYNARFEYGDRGDGVPRYVEYNALWTVQGGIQGAISLGMMKFYHRFVDDTEITRITIEKCI